MIVLLTKNEYCAILRDFGMKPATNTRLHDPKTGIGVWLYNEKLYTPPGIHEDADKGDERLYCPVALDDFLARVDSTRAEAVKKRRTEIAFKAVPKEEPVPEASRKKPAA